MKRFGRGEREQTRVAAAVLAAAGLLLTLLVPYENPSGDATGYGVKLLGREAIPVNPNHWLLLPVVQGIFGAVSRFVDVPPLVVLLWVARLSYVTSLLLVFWIGSRLFEDLRCVLAVTGGYASSWAVLWFATDAEPILLAHVPLLLGGGLHLTGWRARSGPRLFAAGAVYGLSVLVYVSNLLPVAVAALASTIAFLRDRASRHLLVPVVAGSVFLAGMIVAHRASHTPLPLPDWLVTYGGGTSNLAYGGFDALSLFRVVFGFGGSLVASRGAARLVRTWTEGTRSVETQAGDASELALWVLLMVVAFGLTLLALRAARSLDGPDRIVLGVCAASVALLTAFNYQWIGSDPQFWVPVLPLLWVAWGFGLAVLRRGTLLVALLAWGALAPYNALGSLRSVRGDTDPARRRVEVMRATEETCLIVTPGIDWLDTFARLHPMGDRTVLSVWRLSMDPRFADDRAGYFRAIETTLSTAFSSDRRVYVRGIIEEPYSRGIPWRGMEPRGFLLEDIQRFFSRYPHRPAFENRGHVYRELLPPAPP